MEPRTIPERPVPVHAPRSTALRLGVLAALAVAAFSCTLLVARHVHTRSIEDAAEWHRRGTAALRTGDVDAAVTAYRRAVLHTRGERSYVLALASALTRAGQPEAAERAVLAARTAAPEDPAINLALARLAAARGDTDTAVRYFRNALYAPWSTAAGPRDVRRELIEYLLDRGEPRRALPEILGAIASMEPTVPQHLQAADWLGRTGEFGRALEHYTAALRLDPKNTDALEGAGRTAFELGDHAAAVRYLRRVPGSRAAARNLEVAELVLALDPLSPRLGALERRRRLLGLLDRVHERLGACAPADSRLSDLEQWRQRLPRRVDPDEAAGTLEQLVPVVETIRRDCRPPLPLDEALRRLLPPAAESRP